jgi:DNA adenine methylase
MAQLSFFDIDVAKSPVNVSRVSQLSPFRYPGGKTWFVPTLRTWMHSLPKKPKVFIEPFCGGGICSLSVASEGLADHVVMVELDRSVSSVWQTIFSDNSGWLVDQIMDFPEDPDLARSIIESAPQLTHELAFQTIVRNRLLHGGILASGSRMIKKGENGRGPFSRWYPVTLAKRIKYLNELKDRITFIHGDAFDVIRQFGRRKSVCWFIDPPYTATAKSAGKRLYVHHELDHTQLFKSMSKVQGEVLMTYDDTPVVREMADVHGFSLETVSMKNTHHNQKMELVITG